MTNAQVWDDIIKSMHMDKDDAIIHRASVAYNWGLVCNRLKRQRLEKELRSPVGSRGSTNESTIYYNVPIERIDDLWDRAYFELPVADIIDLRTNGGIEYIAYGTGSGCIDSLLGKHFTQVSPSEINMLQGHGMLRPSPQNPYYFRARISTPNGIITNRVWLYGPGATVTNVEVALYLSAAGIESINPDAEVDLPSDMILIAKKMMLDLGRWALLVPGQRLSNDGRDFAPYKGPQPFQPPQQMSINDPANLSIDTING